MAVLRKFFPWLRRGPGREENCFAKIFSVFMLAKELQHQKMMVFLCLPAHPVMASVVYLKMNFNFRPMFGERAQAVI